LPRTGIVPIPRNRGMALATRRSEVRNSVAIALAAPWPKHGQFPFPESPRRTLAANGKPVAYRGIKGVVRPLCHIEDLEGGIDNGDTPIKEFG
jgi:hypothetical protein